ncbi:MAG TPA: hypothetical protein VMV74_08670 [Bacteroidales bacterium]|nr:hypothetical protein [Bacteroidales bacterium]
MPYRRLPNTDSARLRAMKKALDIGKNTPPFNLAYSMKTLVRLQGFLPVFENSISHQRQTINYQMDKSKVSQELTRKARIYLTHFFKVVNMTIVRGELPAETRSFYGIAPEDAAIPSLSTDNELVAWGKRIIDGEEYRIRKGHTPVTNPSIAVVKARYEKFLEARNLHKTLGKRVADCVSRTAEMRSEADELITSVWNEVETKFSDLPENERRTHSERYGLVYVFRKSEITQSNSPTLFEL